MFFPLAKASRRGISALCLRYFSYKEKYQKHNPSQYAEEQRVLTESAGNLDNNY